MSRRTYDPAERAIEMLGLLAVERAARRYAAFTHGNLGDQGRYRAREEAREALLDALSQLDAARGKGSASRTVEPIS